MKQDITTSTETFMNHLNKVMKKPEGYSYELLTHGSKYFKVTMIPRGGGGSVSLLLLLMAVSVPARSDRSWCS